MKNFEEVIFGVISASGEAKSFFMKAISSAKKDDFEKANQFLEEGEKFRVLAGKSHLELLQKEINADTDYKMSLLAVHAEDQMMNAENIQILAKEIIDIYKLLGKKL